MVNSCSVLNNITYLARSFKGITSHVRKQRSLDGFVLSRKYSFFGKHFVYDRKLKNVEEDAKIIDSTRYDQWIRYKATVLHLEHSLYARPTVILRSEQECLILFERLN